jgi:outer membrane protein TolC
VSVAAEVVLTYADLRGTQTRLAVARDNVANQESAAALTEQFLNAGRGTQLDVDRASAETRVFPRASSTKHGLTPRHTDVQVIGRGR